MDLNALRTIPQWGEITGIEVMDPDGFDRTDGHLFERVFTLAEFLKGAMTSTVREGKPKWAMSVLIPSLIAYGRRTPA